MIPFLKISRDIALYILSLRIYADQRKYGKYVSLYSSISFDISCMSIYNIWYKIPWISYLKQSFNSK